MNPMRLRAQNFRSYDAIDLTFPSGAVAIAGPNGAGKSSLIEALDVALFGSRSLGDYLSEDANTPELLVELEFEHAGEIYRVRRSYSAKGRGKSATDLEILEDEEPDADVTHAHWIPITRESQAATQEAIEEILGLSRESFHASALLMQGDSGAFTEAKPAERKAILADVLGLQRWEQLLELVRVDKRQTERAHSELAGRISVLEERSGDTAELEGVCSRLRETLVALEEELAGAAAQLDEAALAARTQETAEATYRERAAAVDAATARAQAKQAILDRATEAKVAAVEVRRELDELSTPEQLAFAERDEERLRLQIAEEEQRAVAYRDAVRERDLLMTRRADLLGEASTKNEEAHALRLQADHALAHVGEATCDLCSQVLGAQAAQDYAKRSREQAETYDFTARELDEQAKAIAIPDIGPEPQRDPELEATFQAQRAATARRREEVVARARLEQSLASLQKTMDEVTPDLMDAITAANRALVDAQNALAEISKPEPGALPQAQAAALAARGRLSDVQARVTQAQAEKAAADARLEAARETFVELEQARLRAGEHVAELEHLATLERAYGRDGIPSLIVEASAIPQIEAEANRILVELGTGYRVELRTQRELKSGDGLADTLDVVVIGDIGARPYETFSGGERSRLNVALRIALARLLAHRRGAESRLLCLDEVEYLDAAGQMALAGVLIELAREEFDRVISVSHADALREMFDTTIVVEKVDGRSRIAA